MTQKRVNRGTKEIKAMMAEDVDFLRPLVRSVIQEFLEAEMAAAVGAEKGERVEGRLSYRSGYYPRSLITRVGKLELRVPQDRNGRFSTEIFERYQRSEKALVAALTEMYIQGVSTRKVKAISEELCGHSFSASAISGFNKKLDEELGRFARRKLDCEYPYLILDARYEKVRENGVIRSRAVLVAIGIDWEGRRQMLGVEMANRESSTSWKDFLLALKARGLRGVIFAVSDDHPGLKRAIMEVLPESYWQRCYVHFLRNALDYLPRKVADDCLVELRWLYDRRNAEEARRDLVAWLLRWQEKYPKLCAWVEDNIEQTLTFYRLPREHHKHHVRFALGPAQQISSTCSR
jgi:putative transposase